MPFYGPANRSSPGTSFRAVTPSDSADLPNGACRGISVGTAGDISVIGSEDTLPVTISSVTQGEHPFSLIRIRATGTTATNITAIY